ncbi:MAG: SPOR domain-containing protein [Bacteroidales bacterium]|nr:SPOR domain-containing protein [Bacteroidales bacterium]HPY82137.1 SPOR domain-containing protein [Bacteroidales bacterium]
MRFSLCLSLLCAVQILCAQVSIENDSISAQKIFNNLAETVAEQGTITINQDPQITELISRHVAINNASESKISGWRIQIYNSTGKETRADALAVRNQFLAKYPDLEAYIIYQPPIFKIRIGNFRTREEAYYYYTKIINDYAASYLIKDQIFLPKLFEN